VSWSATARRVRDADRPLGQRITALHSLLANHHAPLGFTVTRKRLRKLVAVGPADGGRSRSCFGHSRSWSSRERAICDTAAPSPSGVERRRRTDDAGPTKGDVEALHRAEWLKVVEEDGWRQASCRERRRRTSG
jgi:hypothetical protein